MDSAHHLEVTPMPTMEPREPDWMAHYCPLCDSSPCAGAGCLGGQLTARLGQGLRPAEPMPPQQHFPHPAGSGRRAVPLPEGDWATPTAVPGHIEAQRLVEGVQRRLLLLDATLKAPGVPVANILAVRRALARWYTAHQVDDARHAVAASSLAGADIWPSGWRPEGWRIE